MNAPHKPASKRFNPTRFTQKVVPVLLLLLVLVLAAITILAILAGTGVI